MIDIYLILRSKRAYQVHIGTRQASIMLMSYQARISIVLPIFMDDTHPRGDMKFKGPCTQWYVRPVQF
jgi:hypothetical protein